MIRTIEQLSLEEYMEMQAQAIDWQYLTVQAGGMARKSQLDAWLQNQYDIDLYAAHTIANSTDEIRAFEIDRDGIHWIGSGPEPTA